MNVLRNLTLGLVLLAVASCGHPTNTAPVAASAASSNVPTVKTKSGSFKLGYDYKLYNKKFKPNAHVTHIASAGRDLPASVDNRGTCAPVYNQGFLGSCTAFAMGKGLREYLQRQNPGETPTPLSALFMYYNERVLNNTVNEDSGATMTQGMQVLRDNGIAPDVDDPYSWTYLFRFKTKPSEKAYQDATAWKTPNSIQLPDGGLDDIRTAVAAKKPVVFGFIVYQTFMSAETQQTGQMEWPHPEQGEQVAGGHAVMVAGYDDTKRVLIMRNSWDTTWGDKGYFYMPYAFVSGSTDGQQNVMEIWTAD